VDFTNKNLAVLFKIGDTTVYFDETLRTTWIVMGILVLFAIFVRLKLSGFKSIPSGFQNVIESLVEVMSNFVKSTMGADAEVFGGIFFSIFAFILCCNYSGLLGLRPPTADLATTGALALLIFFMIHFFGFRKQKKKHIKSFFEPYPIFFPINLVGELSKPISLGFRLFGNILGGVIILGLVYEMFPLVMRFVLPNILHAYFDVFAGALQSFIFTILSMTFIQQKMAAE